MTQYIRYVGQTRPHHLGRPEGNIPPPAASSSNYTYINIVVHIITIYKPILIPKGPRGTTARRIGTVNSEISVWFIIMDIVERRRDMSSHHVMWTYALMAPSRTQNKAKLTFLLESRHDGLLLDIRHRVKNNRCSVMVQLQLQLQLSYI